MADSKGLLNKRLAEGISLSTPQAQKSAELRDMALQRMAKADEKAAAAEEKGQTSFLRELGSQRSILTGLLAGGAALAGEKDVALGLAAGGLVGTSQRADAINAQRRQELQSYEQQGFESLDQAIRAQLPIMQTEAGLAETSAQLDFKALEVAFTADTQKELELMRQDMQRWSINSEQDFQRTQNALSRKLQIDLLDKNLAFQKEDILREYGVSSWEELLAGRGTKEIDAELQKDLQASGIYAQQAANKYLADVDYVREQVVNNKWHLLTEEQAQLGYGLHLEEVRKMSRDQQLSSTRQTLATQTLHGMLSSDQFDADAALQQARVLGYSDDSEFANSIRGLAAAKDVDSRNAYLEKIENIFLQDGNPLSVLAYKDKITELMVVGDETGRKLSENEARERALPLLKMDDLPSNVQRADMNERRRVIALLYDKWLAEGTDNADPVNFIMTKAGLDEADIAILDTTGGIADIAQNMMHTDANYLAAEKARMHEYLMQADEQYIKMQADPKRAGEAAVKLMDAVVAKQAADRIYKLHTVYQPEIESRASAMYDSILGISGSEHTAEAARTTMLRLGTVIDPSPNITDDEFKAEMADVEKALIDAAKSEDAFGFVDKWVAFVESRKAYTIYDLPDGLKDDAPQYVPLITETAGLMNALFERNEVEKAIEQLGKTKIKKRK